MTEPRIVEAAGMTASEFMYGGMTRAEFLGMMMDKAGQEYVQKVTDERNAAIDAASLEEVEAGLLNLPYLDHKKLRDARVAGRVRGKKVWAEKEAEYYASKKVS